MKFSIYGRIKHVPNHQPDMYKWWFSRKPCSISDIQNFQMETLLSGLSMIVHTWAILLWYTTLSFKKTKRNIMIIKLFFGGTHFFLDKAQIRSVLVVYPIVRLPYPNKMCFFWHDTRPKPNLCLLLFPNMLTRLWRYCWTIPSCKQKNRCWKAATFRSFKRSYG